MEPADGTSNLYALLIGVDHYLPNRLPDGSYYASLGGCVRDILHVEAFLRRKLSLSQKHVFKLTASNSGGREPLEPPEQWPTYENMVSALKRLTERAQAGDHLYIHYSGHGGRAGTLLPERKGADGIDEALVPTDIGSTEARYLRDIELAHLLNTMVEKGLVVTVVLDSCHSGGLTRGRGDVAIRGLSTIDTTERSTESLVASKADLAAVWQRLDGGAKRSVSLGSGWLPEPKGYVLLAACRPSEFAYEYAFDGKERNGALTYWLLDALQDLGPGLSYKLLHDRILPRVHSQFVQQTPQLQGEGDREVFGSRRVRSHYAVPVIDVDEAKGRLLLNAGQAHGLRKGAQFAIYPSGTTDFTGSEKRLALAGLSELGATGSWVEITERFDARPVEQGDQAVLLGSGSIKLVQKVCLVRRDDLERQADQEAALAAVRRAMEASGWVEPAADAESPRYQVALNEKGEYELWDGSGAPIPLRPVLKPGNPDAAAGVVRRLDHLAKYHAVLRLDNHDERSPLARKLVVEVVGKQQDYDPVDAPEWEPFDEPGHTPVLTVGEWTFLRIRNDAAQVLNVAMLDLQPDWGITQVYPPGKGDYFVAFEPGEEKILPLKTDLPGNYEQGTDVLKVFATVGSTNFRWLELPPLDEQRVERSLSRAPEGPLEKVLSAFTSERPRMRNVTFGDYPSAEWVTAQVEVRMQRRKQKEARSGIG